MEGRRLVGVYGWVSGLMMNRWMGGCLDEWVDGWMGERLGGGLFGWKDA